MTALSKENIERAVKHTAQCSTILLEKEFRLTDDLLKAKAKKQK